MHKSFALISILLPRLLFHFPLSLHLSLHLSLSASLHPSTLTLSIPLSLPLHPSLIRRRLPCILLPLILLPLPQSSRNARRQNGNARRPEESTESSAAATPDRKFTTGLRRTTTATTSSSRTPAGVADGVGQQQQQQQEQQEQQQSRVNRSHDSISEWLSNMARQEMADISNTGTSPSKSPKKHHGGGGVSRQLMPQYPPSPEAKPHPSRRPPLSPGEARTRRENSPLGAARDASDMGVWRPPRNTSRFVAEELLTYLADKVMVHLDGCVHALLPPMGQSPTSKSCSFQHKPLKNPKTQTLNPRIRTSRPSRHTWLTHPRG